MIYSVGYGSNMQQLPLGKNGGHCFTKSKLTTQLLIQTANMVNPEASATPL